MSLRALLAPPLLAVLLSGCSTVVAGQPEPADHNGPAPVSKTALRHALLSGDELDAVMDASGIAKKASRDDLSADSPNFSDASCLAAWQPIQKSVYADSGWTSLRAEVLHDNRDNESANHFVIQSVVAFPSKAKATEFFDSVTPDWDSCGDRQVTSPTGGGVETHWDLGAANNTESTLSMTRTQRGTNGWSCQRALRATNNIVIDVLACAYHVGDDGVRIVDEIDAKLPSV